MRKKRNEAGSSGWKRGWKTQGRRRVLRWRGGGKTWKMSRSRGVGGGSAKKIVVLNYTYLHDFTQCVFSLTLHRLETVKSAKFAGLASRIKGALTVRGVSWIV